MRRLCRVSIRTWVSSELLTLSDESVEVLVVGSLDTEVASTDVVDCLVVDHEAAVGVLKSGVSSQNGVIWLDNGCSNLRRRIDTEFELALLAVVDRETLHQQRTEAGPSATTEGVEDEETLETSATICNTSNLVEDLVDEFLADSIVTTSIIVGRILLASDHLLGME